MTVMGAGEPCRVRQRPGKRGGKGDERKRSETMEVEKR